MVAVQYSGAPNNPKQVLCIYALGPKVRIVHLLGAIPCSAFNMQHLWDSSVEGR